MANINDTNKMMNEGWSDMKIRLDEVMPQKKKRRLFPIWFMGFLSGGLLLYLAYQVFNSPEKNNNDIQSFAAQSNITTNTLEKDIPLNLDNLTIETSKNETSEIKYSTAVKSNNKASTVFEVPTNVSYNSYTIKSKEEDETTIIEPKVLADQSPMSLKDTRNLYEHSTLPTLSALLFREYKPVLNKLELVVPVKNRNKTSLTLFSHYGKPNYNGGEFMFDIGTGIVVNLSKIFFFQPSVYYHKEQVSSGYKLLNGSLTSKFSDNGLSLDAGSYASNSIYNSSDNIVYRKTSIGLGTMFGIRLNKTFDLVGGIIYYKNITSNLSDIESVLTTPVSVPTANEVNEGYEITTSSDIRYAMGVKINLNQKLSFNFDLLNNIRPMVKVHLGDIQKFEIKSLYFRSGMQYSF